MARCGCGGGSCQCYVEAGTGTTVTGSGSSVNPYVVSVAAANCSATRACLSAGMGASYSPATGVIAARASTDAGNLISFGTDGGLYSAVNCATIRACLSEGDGIDYDSASGQIAARLSADPGNQVAIGGDGGLYVPATTASVETGCGLTGDGTGGSPLAVATGVWPYPCPVDTFGSAIVCDSSGKLRGEPRGTMDFVQQINSTLFSSVPVPSGATVTIVTDNLNITNPDSCRPAMVIIETEVDVDITYPANSGATVGIAADDMLHMENKGSGQLNEVHWQIAKTFRASIPAGGAIIDPIQVRVGAGFGGSTYTRVQVIHRAWTFAM